MSCKPICLVAVGDLSLNGAYGKVLKRKGVDHPFQRVQPAWGNADLRLGNLESPLATGPRFAFSKLALRAAPQAAAALHTAGFDCLSLANNHIMDYGPEGLAQTRAALAAEGIAHVGAGADARDASAPALLRRQGQTVAVLAYCDVEQTSPLYAGPGKPGVAGFGQDDVIRRIRELRPRVDWVIVQVHWGMEMAELPLPEQRARARDLVRAGADLILGHHPHVLQPMELVDGVPVFYSLGNFLFSEMYWRGWTNDGPFVSKYRLHPFSMRTGWVEVVFERGRPPQAWFHPARLEDDLAVSPEPTPDRFRQWEVLCQQLTAPEYPARAVEEVQRAGERLAWQVHWKSLPRWVELKLFDFGLLPQAVEGD